MAKIVPQVGERQGVCGLTDRTALRLAAGLFALGLAWRTIRYLLQFPVWGDEALLATNFAWLDFAQLTQRLENCQVAPLLFLWAERAAYTMLGAGELSLRLLPYLASVTALALFWRLTGLLLNPSERLFAVGFLAMASFSVATSNALKPYAFDLLAATALVTLCVQWLRTPGQKRWLILLAFLAPVALLVSYPAVFVAAAISVALLKEVWKQGWKSRCWFAAYQVSLLAGFWLSCFIGSRQLQTVTNGTSTQVGMAAYWDYGFPPSTWWRWPLWFLRQTTGQMMAYPIGDADGGSMLTVICVVAGGLALWQRRQRAYLAIFALPLALNLIAAALHRYPYGAAARLSQHLAPGICLLAGLGLAALIARAKPAARVKWSYTLTAVFVFVGLGGLGRDLLRPYYSRGANWMRSTMKQIHAQLDDRDAVVVCGDSRNMEIVFVWYWLNEGRRVTWNCDLPRQADTGRVWGFHQGPEADLHCSRLQSVLVQRDPAWRLEKRIAYGDGPARSGDPAQRCELFCFVNDVRLAEARAAGSSGAAGLRTARAAPGAATSSTRR